ncbi:MAG TPA: hypothetical protein ENH88_06670 [Pseudoalteromonas prydzensis]|uniref:Lipoprotein n=1 Tax=Pseudoalteromonas prydzensis TaxID=182141 RepID=A0A7V1GEB6_9GAMM|nr:hypothetical protein [Pseudoalteromonas prydzensis]HEA16117.1 hypothetical protein [Pseudoalteromonas prydzensis]
MKNKHKLQIVILSIALMGGCKKNATQVDRGDETVNSSALKEQEQALNSSKKQHNPVEKQLISKSINNNGDKISYKTDKLLKGTIVFNHATAEQGIVTGTVFITLRDDILPLELKNTYDVKKVTKHTYRFLVDKNTDLKLTISDLKQFASIESTEIAVNYSPIEEQF